MKNVYTPGRAPDYFEHHAPKGGPRTGDVIEFAMPEGTEHVVMWTDANGTDQHRSETK